ncbi:MAG TPA: amidohydrolase family protein [Xanthobacteraceae bacterium]|jgi:aminocarboxymuconate-semialdehyde decarboxylase|nr:amidohydrolase family protein [Xanthobacteraceae bacterium]
MSKIWNKYADTAARTHGKRGRDVRPKSVTIDIHAHAAVPAAAKFVGDNLDVSTIPLAHFASAHTKELNAKQEGDIRSRMTDYDDRLRDMDEMGVDIQFVMPPPPQLYHTVKLDIAVPAARIVNEGIAEYTSRHADRLIPCGTVPMQDGHEAAKELEYCVKTLGFKGVEILTNVNGKELSDPAFEPFWKKAEELGALVVLHPNGFTEGRRLSQHYFNNVIGNPFETTLALHYLIFDGVLERYPNLKILAVHGGGYLAAYSGRIDHAWGARSDCHNGLPHPPTSYLKKIYFDTVVFTPLQLETLVKTFGVERIVMGTDFPFDMLEHDPIGHIAAIEAFDDKTRAALAGNNAKQLLGL